MTAGRLDRLPPVVRRQVPTLVVLAGAAVATLYVTGNAVRLDTSIFIGINALIALSVGISYGHAGVLSVAQAAFAALGAYTTAILTVRYGWSPFVSLPLSLALPAVVAYPVARYVTRLSHLALAIATLLFGDILLVLLRQGGDFTGGFNGISAIPRPGPFDTSFRYHLLVWLVVCVAVALVSNAVTTTEGRAMRTIRHDPLRARADGVDVPTSLAGVFTFAAMLAGAAGWLYAHYISYLAPESLPPSLSISVILMAVIGGAAYVVGPIVGAVFLGVFETYLPAEQTKGLLYGGVLVAVLLVAPEGMLGMAGGWLRRRRQRRRRVEAPVATPSAPEGLDVVEVGS